MDATTPTDPDIDAAKRRRARLTGIALMCGAVASFACLDTTAKYLNGHMDTLQVVWARYTSAFLLALILSNPLTRPGLLRTTRPWLQFGRSLLLLGATVFNFFALRWLQLDQSLAIMFATPFIVAALSGPLLGEWVGPRRWAAIGVGFIGILVVTRPGFGGIHPAAVLTVLGAICYALLGIVTRFLAGADSDETTLFYSNLTGAVVVIPILPFVWSTPAHWSIVVLMITMGLFASFGHYLLIVAHRLAPASVLSPFIYSQIIWMTALGYAVFSDVPNAWTLAGAAIVIASGLYLLYREHVRKGTVAPLP